MGGKLIFGAGVGIGYLLGTRAGRERYEKITGQAKRFWENNTVQEAAGAVQTQAGRLYDEGKKMVTDQAHKLKDHQHHGKPDRELRRRNFPDRNRKGAGWEPAGFQANPTTTPY